MTGYRTNLMPAGLDGFGNYPTVAAANRGRLVGLIARSEAHITKPLMNDIADTFTMNLNWADAEPTQGGALNLNKLEQWHQYAVDHNYPRFRIRIYSGDKAPTWAKTLGGFTPIPWKGADGSGKPVGPFWRQDHRDAYYSFTQRLAVAVGSVFPRVAEVTDSTTMTIYAENYLRGWSVFTVAERQAVIAQGYSYQEDEESLVESQDRQYALWSKIGVSVLHTFNTWQRCLDNGSTVMDQPWTMGMLDRWGSKGRFAIPFNTSLGNPVTVRGPTYKEVWEHQCDYWPAGIQTMTMAKMTTAYPPSTPQDTVALAASLGFIDVELPLGCENHTDPAYRIDPSEAVVLSASLAANVKEGQI